MAIVDTQGRFTEYGKDLIEAAKEYGSFVGILVDYDATGVDIHKATRTATHKIGIDKETVIWLQQHGCNITLEGVEEEYTPPNNITIEDPYLETHRVELDSIEEKVGPEKLWEYIMYRVELLAAEVDGLNYTNVILKPTSDTLYQTGITEFMSDLQKYVSGLIEPKWQEIFNELTDVPELIDIEVKTTKIHEDLSPIVNKDSRMQQIEDKLKEMRQLFSNG